MDKVFLAIQVSLAGMLATFAVLLLLHFIVTALARISPAAETAQGQRPLAQVNDEQEDEDMEDAAAIVAALSAGGISPEGGYIRIEKISG